MAQEASAQVARLEREAFLLQAQLDTEKAKVGVQCWEGSSAPLCSLVNGGRDGERATCELRWSF